MFIVKTKKEIMGLALILFIGITSGVIINISPIKGVFSINKNIKTNSTKLNKDESEHLRNYIDAMTWLEKEISKNS